MKDLIAKLQDIRSAVKTYKLPPLVLFEVDDVIKALSGKISKPTEYCECKDIIFPGGMMLVESVNPLTCANCHKVIKPLPQKECNCGFTLKNLGRICNKCKEELPQKEPQEILPLRWDKKNEDKEWVLAIVNKIEELITAVNLIRKEK